MEKNSLDKRNFYNQIADKYQTLEHPYDLSRRLDLVFNDLLGQVSLKGKTLLDAGCGHGPFSYRAAELGAAVVSLDISHKLLLQAKQIGSNGCVLCDSSQLCFEENAFDIVISSEMVEHTISPISTIAQLLSVTKPNGILVITTPNKKWEWLVRLASSLKLRPFQGYEIFPSWHQLEKFETPLVVKPDRHVGFHLFPFQFGLSKLSDWIDRRFGETFLAQFMINQAILVVKPEA